MTAAKLVTSPGEASGLTHSLNDKVYADLVAGRPPGTIAVVGLLVPVEHGEKRTAKGTHRHVRYDFLRLEPVKDAHDADQVAWQVTRAYEQRTSPSGGHQTELPLDSPAAQREALLEDLRAWSSDNDISRADLDDEWLSYFGGSEHAASATVQAGSLLHLMEFARYKGAVDDGPFGEPAAAAEVDPDDEDDTGADDEPGTAEDLTPAAGDVPFSGGTP